jgi:hypothetical protein
MVRLIAAFSVSLVLAQFGDFLQKVGVETPLPLNEQMLDHTIVHTNEEAMSTRVFGRYYLNFWKDKVRVFTDRDENLARTLTRLDPQEMLELSRKSPVIDEEQARQIACEVFYRLGYQDKDFDPPAVHRFTYQPNEFDRRVLPLPYFHIQWDLKGATRTGNSVIDPCIQMYISGMTKHLVYYSSGSMALHKEP